MLKHPTSSLRGGRRHSSKRSSMKPSLLLQQQKFGVSSMQQVDKDLKMVGMICEEVKISYLLWFPVIVSTKCLFLFCPKPLPPPKHLLIQIGTVTCHLSCCYCISCLLLQGGRRLRSAQQRLLTDLCISIR